MEAKEYDRISGKLEQLKTVLKLIMNTLSLNRVNRGEKIFQFLHTLSFLRNMNSQNEDKE